MSDPWTNPMGTDGFEFLEFAAPEPALLDKLFRGLGFGPVACHRAKDVTLYRQGGINLILNVEPASFAQSYARVHGPSICAVALRVRNARAAAERAQRLGAEVVPLSAGPMELNIPAIRGIGGSLIYLVDRYGEGSGRINIYDIDFVATGTPPPPAETAGLNAIHRLEYSVHPGRAGVWTDFFTRLFAFRPVDGHLLSPCGTIRLGIGEAGTDGTDDLAGLHRGEGIRTAVFATDDLTGSTERLRHLAASGTATDGELRIDDPTTLGTTRLAITGAK